MARRFHCLESASVNYHFMAMCGRYASFLPAEAIARVFGTVSPLPHLAPSWNMAPTMAAPVVRLLYGDRHLDALNWGLVPYFTKEIKKARMPINARDDNVTKSGMFREAFTKRRCLVPAPVYYEWRDDPDGKTGHVRQAGAIWQRSRSADRNYGSDGIGCVVRD